MNTKAIVEVQFNWIFVLVIGAIILVFFFGFVERQKDFAEEKNAARFMNDLEAILVGAQVSKESSFPIAIPRIPLHVSCDETCLCTYGVRDVSQQYKDAIIFGSDPIEGTTLLLWSKEWKMPFRVTNLLFAGSEKTRYVIVYDDSAQSRQWKNILEKNIPEVFDVQWLNVSAASTIRYDNEPFTKILVLDNTMLPPDFVQQLNSEFEGRAANMVMIENNQLLFYDKLQLNSDMRPQAPQHFFDETSIYAALFAKDKQMYSCNMRSTFSRLIQVAAVLQNRMEQLEKEDINNQCIYNTDDPILGEGDYHGLNQIMQSATQILAEEEITSGGTTLQNALSQLRRENQLKIQKNCPQIY